MSAEIVCLGLATLDTIVALPRWPDPEGRLIAEKVMRAGGGPAATAAVTAARLGRSAAFIGAVGSDEPGTTVRRELLVAGVDVSLLLERPGRTSESVILVERQAATRSILHAPGVEAGPLGAAARAACEAAAWVHVDHAGWPLATGLPRARLSVDAGNPIAALDLAGLGLYAPPVAALQARYPGLSVPAAVSRALAEGAGRVAVTLGAEGALAADGAGAWRVGGAAGPVISTVGAGDVFHGAILAALVEGHPLPQALRFANLAAALSCRGLDGRSAIPGRAELEVALKSTSPAEPVDLRAAA